MKTHSLAGAVAGLCLALAGSGTPAAAAGTAGLPGAARTLTVFAAASLKETFTTLKNRFQAGNPDVQVTLNFGGSSELAQDLVEGARADVFAAASDTTMKRVTEHKFQDLVTSEPGQQTLRTAGFEIKHE